jgi:hypothetical protein
MAAPVSAQPRPAASATRVVPPDDPGALPGAAAAVAVSSACVSVGAGVGMSPGDDFPRIPVTSIRAALLAHSDRRRQAAVRQIDGVS